MKKVAIYCRISTDEDLQKYSLPAQEKELQEFASRKGWEVTGTYRDTISGSKANRPGLDALRDDLAAGKFDAILCVDQDRLSRLEPIDWELLKRELREAKVSIVTPAQVVNFDDEDSELVSDIFNLFARHQRRKIKKAMRRGREEAFRQGKWPGQPPFGYQLKDQKLEPEPSQAEVVQRIFELYARGLGTWEICQRLNAEGVPSPYRRTWKPAGTLRILTNPAYTGTISVHVNGKHVEVHQAHPAIIHEELWARCQEIYQRRSDEYKQYHTAAKRGLLSDVLYCSECGQRLHVKTNTSRGRAYYHYKHRPRQCGQDLPAKCKVSHQLEALDAKVIAAVKAIGSSPEAARQFIYFRNDGKERKKLQARLAGLEKARQSLAAKQKKLLALYLDGDWDKSFLDEQKKSLEAQIRLNEKQRQEIRAQLTFLSGEQADLDYIVEYFAALTNFDTEMTREQQLTLVRAMFTRAEVDREGNLNLTCRIPLPGDGQVSQGSEALVVNGRDQFQSHRNAGGTQQAIPAS